MANIDITILPLLKDNYAYILHNRDTNKVAVIDPSVSGPVIEWLDQRQLQADHVLNTHHHWDHVGGNSELRARYVSDIVGNDADKHRIPEITRTVKTGETFHMLDTEWRVIDTPGHTIGHVAFYVPELKALFCGDTLFGLGCGGIFEGTPAQMWQSLLALRALPDDTKIYCGHEYTLALSRFALGFDSENEELRKYVASVQEKRKAGQPSVPFEMGLEKRVNPFLQADSTHVQEILDMRQAKSEDVFARMYEIAD